MHCNSQSVQITVGYGDTVRQFVISGNAPNFICMRIELNIMHPWHKQCLPITTELNSLVPTVYLCM